eukprot:3618816-Karenia_brevis.AAC.1
MGFHFLLIGTLILYRTSLMISSTVCVPSRSVMTPPSCMDSMTQPSAVFAKRRFFLMKVEWHVGPQAHEH